MSLGINVLAYATNRELKTKEDFFRADRHAAAGRSGGTRPAVRGQSAPPRRLQRRARALVNLMDAASRELKIRTHVRDELLDITDVSLFDYHLVFMHGRTAFRLTDAERQRLRQYVERGGMMLADSICASRAFSESFRREMAAIFPGRKLERIPAERSAFEHGLRRVRSADRLAPRPGAAAPASHWRPRSTRSRPTWRASSWATAGAWSSRPTI